jgi:hypothetical protein
MLTLTGPFTPTLGYTGDIERWEAPHLPFLIAHCSLLIR